MWLKLRPSLVPLSPKGPGSIWAMPWHRACDTIDPQTLHHPARVVGTQRDIPGTWNSKQDIPHSALTPVPVPCEHTQDFPPCPHSLLPLVQTKPWLQPGVWQSQTLVTPPAPSPGLGSSGKAQGRLRLGSNQCWKEAGCDPAPLQPAPHPVLSPGHRGIPAPQFGTPPQQRGRVPCSARGAFCVPSPCLFRARPSCSVCFSSLCSNDVCSAPSTHSLGPAGVSPWFPHLGPQHSCPILGGSFRK